MLEKAADDDVVMNKRSFYLLVFAAVLFPKTSNMVLLEYLDILLDMDKFDEFAWDEEISMFAQVVEFQEKRRFQLQNLDKPITPFNISTCLSMLVVCSIPILLVFSLCLFELLNLLTIGSNNVISSVLCK